MMEVFNQFNPISVLFPNNAIGSADWNSAKNEGNHYIQKCQKLSEFLVFWINTLDKSDNNLDNNFSKQKYWPTLPEYIESRVENPDEDPSCPDLDV